MRRRFTILIVTSLLMSSCLIAAFITSTAAGTRKPPVLHGLYTSRGLIEIVSRSPTEPPVHSAPSTRELEAEPPVLLGLYTSRSLMESANEITKVDAWLSKVDARVSIAGTFMDLEWPNPADNVLLELEAAWSHGYMPFVNLMIGTIREKELISQLLDSAGYPDNRTAAFVASDPRIDPVIRSWARAFAEWSDGGRKKAFIAPLHEMNGSWVRYGLDPENYKRAYLRIQRIFREEGVAEEAVSWVFAPNGWSDDAMGHPRFEAYFPGNSVVDVVAFSSFNYGHCVPYIPSWNRFDEVFKSYLDRMSAMAPGKPIFIDQTGSVDWGGDKNEWLRESFTELASYPGLRAVLYFHKKKSEGLPCDPVEYRFYAPSEGVEYPGVLEALGGKGVGYGYWEVSDPAWSEIAFAPPRGGNRFEDVEPAHPFSGVKDVWYYPWVEAVAAAGLTEGCGTNPYTELPIYCPNRVATRAETAVFMLRARYGPAYRPPQPDGSSMLADISGHWAEAWIEDLYDKGIASGYGDGTFRPDEPVTRAEMAVFLLKTKHGFWYQPPATRGGAFNDIAGHWAQAWIEQLKAEGIASGYTDGSYQPEKPITRAEMAVFLGRAFNLSRL